MPIVTLILGDENFPKIEIDIKIKHYLRVEKESAGWFEETATARKQREWQWSGEH